MRFFEVGVLECRENQMSKCDISVELDSLKPTYTAGDYVRGQVTVSVDADCKCKALRIELLWESEGKGDRCWDVADVDIPFAGEWLAGTEHTYPFELMVPNGPHTYRGHHLTVDWRVRATADIPWARDPSAEAELVVQPGAQTDPATYINTDGKNEGIADKRPLESGVGKWLMLLGIAMIGGGSFVTVMPFLPNTSDFPVPIGVPLGLTVVGAGVWWAYKALQNTMARKKLGRVVVEVPRDPVLTGQSLPVEVRLDAVAREHLQGAQVTLRCREHVHRGTGNSRRSFFHDAYRKVVNLEEVVGAPAKAVGRMVLEASLPIPSNAPPSFYGESNELYWVLEIELAVKNWANFEHKQYIEVLPAPARAQP